MAKKKKIYNAITGEFETQGTTSSSASSVSKGYDATKGSYYDIAPVKTTTTKKKDNDSLLSAFNDGYDFGDVSKTILKGGKKLGVATYNVGKEAVTHPIKTAKTVGVSVASGVDKADESINNAIGDFFDWITPGKEKEEEGLSVKEYNKLIKSGTKEEKESVLKELEKTYGKDSKDYKFYEQALNSKDTRSDTNKTIDNILNKKYYETETYKNYEEGKLTDGQKTVWNVGENIGNMLPSIAVSTITGNPALGSAVFFTQAQQNYTEEAKERGYTDKDARTYGLIMGGAEVVVERLGFDELGGLKKLSGGSIKKAMAGEGLEEFVMPYIDSTVKSIGYGEDFDFQGATEEALESAVMGAVTGGIMNAGGKGLVKVDNFIEKVNSGQEITQNDFVEAGKEIEQADPEYFNEIMKNVPEVIKAQTQNTQTQQNNDIAPVKQANTEVEQVNQEANQIIQETQDLEKALKQQNYQYKAQSTDSIQRKTISEDASKYANNTTRTHEFVDTLVNVSEATGINIRLTNNQSEEMTTRRSQLAENYARNNNVSMEEATKRFENTTIDAYNTGSEIVINLDSPKALNRLVGHEVTHSLEGTKEYSNLQKIASEYAKTKGEYNLRVETLEALYEGTNASIENELTSDLVGDYLFTDQEFINHIHNTNRNLFQKVYDEIKHLYKMATAGSKEARQLEQLKHSFEKAMKENKQSTRNEISKTTTQEAKTNLATETESNTQEKTKTKEEQVTKVEKKETNKKEVENSLSKKYETKQEINKDIKELNKQIYSSEISDTLKQELKNKVAELKKIRETLPNTEQNTQAKTISHDEYIKNEVKQMISNSNVDTITDQMIDETIYDSPKYQDNNELFDEVYDEILTELEKEGFSKRYDKSKNRYVYDTQELAQKGYNELLDYLDKQNIDYEISNSTEAGYVPSIYIKDSTGDTIFRIANHENGYISEKDMIYNDTYNKLFEDKDYANWKENIMPYVEEQLENNDLNVVPNTTPTQAELDNLENIRKNKSGSEYASAFYELEKKYGKANLYKGLNNYNSTGKALDTNYSLSDNQGRTLTQEQQEYFKDSKVRDENGNLLTMYHGTRADFNTFDMNRAGQNYEDSWSQSGKGFYFTKDYDTAYDYSEASVEGNKRTVKEVYLDVKNPFYSFENYTEELSSLKEKYNIDDLSLKRGYSLVNVLNQNGYDSTKVLQELGYDGIIDVYNGQIEDVVVFESNQIKNTNNTNPTLSEDIRYSLSTTDNQGRQLSKEQVDYFKDSKVRDSEGRLLEVYHGTPYGGFNEFDSSHMGSSDNGGYLGDGFYFTDSYEYAKDFTDENFMDEYDRENAQAGEYGNPQVYNTYLDIKNPYIINESDVEYDSNTLSNALGTNFNYEATNLLEQQGYDGIIYNFESGTKEYLVFNSEQIKSVDNANPTNNVDIRKSLSNENTDIAPTSTDVFGKDIKLQQEQTVQEQVQEVIAPLQETIQELNNKITNLQENIAPTSQQEVEQQGRDSFQAITDENAPTRLENTTPEYENTNEVVNDPFENRDIKEVGKRNVNAYMYENPEVKPYFQQTAKEMLTDLDNSIKGEKIWLQELNPTTGLYENNMVTGTQRLTTDDIAELLDTYHYTYDQIRKGLNAIIEDDGKENNAVSKRIEFMLNDRLLNGYKSIDGFPIPANEEYQALIRDKNIQEYSQQAYEEWAKTINQDELAPINIDNASNMNVEAQNIDLGNDLPTDNLNIPRVEESSLNEVKNKPSTKETILADPITEFNRALDRQIGNEMTFKKSQPKVTKTKGQQVQNAFSKFQQEFVNRNYQIDKMAKDTGNKQIKFKGDMLNNVAGEIDGDIFTAQTDNYGNAIGDSLSSLFEKAKQGGYYEAFDDYLKHYSNIDRHKFGKGSVVPLEYSQKMIAEYDKAYPQLRGEATKVWKYGKNLLANMQSNGLISGQFNSTLQGMYPHYVPFMQDSELTPYMSEDGTVKPKKVIKRAYGGAEEILGIEEAFTKYTYATKKAIRQNDLYKEIVNTSNDKVSIGADVRVDPTNLNESLGVDDKGNYYVTAYEDGNMKQATISEDLYNELSRDAENKVRALEERYEIVTKPLQKISEVRRNLLTTWSPSFLLTNPIKDIQDALLNSKYTKDFLKNYPSSFVELAQGKTKTAKQFLTLYGSGNVMGEYNSNSYTQNTNLNNSNFAKKLANGVSKANNILELAPRYAEFKASLENGANIQEAMYNAREVTTNFGRGGYITKAMNRNGFTFLNASVQGFDKLIRNFSGENGAKGVVSSFAKVSAFAIAPALINALAFGVGDDEDEDYKALPDYIKDNYYLIKTGDGEFIRIPKGRMLSIFGSAGRRALEYANGEKDAFEGYLTNAYSQVGVQNPLENNILAPIIQAVNNETWYGGDLVPTRLQDKPVEEQYDETTDEFSKLLGQLIGVSPYKINYVLDQYSGGIGDIVLPMITEEATNDSEGFGNLLAPIKDKFTANTTFDNKYVSEFYDTNEKLKVKANSSNATEEDILKNKYMYSVSSEMSELYKEKREVQNDDSLTKQEKYKKVQEIQKQINSLAEEGLNGYEKINKTSNYAIVNDREYYKNANDEWTTPYEDELDELNSLGMDIDEKSNYFEAKNGIYEITEKYRNTEDMYAQKKAEIINVVKNSNLTDDQKGYLYGKYYSEEKTEIINSLGINFNSYLDYEAQNFVADKDSKGNSISGSKKKKVFDYINSMNLSFEEKLVLAKLEYNSYDEYNYEIIDYLNNSNITYDEEVYILKKLGFTVDNEGNIYWD